MHNFFVLVVGGLVTWRISHMLVKEGGPVMVFARMRALFATRQKRSGGLFDLISCVYCTSVYVGLVASVFASHSILQWIAYGIAFSAITALLERLTYDSNSFTVVAPPTAHNKIPIGVGSTPKKGNNMVSHPASPDGYMTVETQPPLND